MKTLDHNNSHCDQKMEKEKLGDKEYVVGERQKSQLRKEIKKIIEEGGTKSIESGEEESSNEELTHWIVPDHLLLSYFPEEVREEVEDFSMEELRECCN